MTAPVSNDLRRRVVRAIDGGLSRRAASARFDVSIASAVRWYQRYKRTGRVEPDAIGGDRHSHRAEVQAPTVLGWIDENRDITLVEIAARLASQGHVFLRKLTRRGLRGVKLVISDAHEGLKAAVTRVLCATWQRCRVHFMRNVLAHAGKSGRRVVSAFIATAFAQETPEAASAQWRAVADQRLTASENC